MPPPAVLKPAKPVVQKPEAKKPEAKKTEEKPPYYKEFKNYGEFQQAIAAAQARESEANKDIKNLQTRVRGIKYRIRAVEDNLKATQNDIAVYKKILESKERRR